MKIQILLLVLFFWGLPNNLFGQKKPVFNTEPNKPIYEIEQKLKQGNILALFDIAQYFDSLTEVTEFLGYHPIPTTQAEIAKRIVQENCIFTDSEISITKELTTKEFLTFLTGNKDKITFCNLADAFLVTPLEKMTSMVEFRTIPVYKREQLKASYSELLTKEWVVKAKIDSLISINDSKALLLISSELYKIRYRFNIHHFNYNEYIELLQHLLGIDIAVGNEKNNLTWHIDKAFNPKFALNLLIYFTNNYTKFKWNAQSSAFLNEEIQAKAIGREEDLFLRLCDKNRSIAFDAFVQLTTCNSAKVIKLADEYQTAFIEPQSFIVTFPYRFLKQLVILTEYSQQNNVDFVGTAALQSAITRLKSDLNFTDRRKLEDSLINTLQLEDITALEYWALIHESSRVTYSAGRILDIFYSKHWSELLNNKQHLVHFLKKSYLFKKLGIIGICNNYLAKFTNLGEKGIVPLSTLQTDDIDIIQQIEKAKLLCNKALQPFVEKKKFGNGNRDYDLSDISAQINSIVTSNSQKNIESKLVELLSQITYSQIGEALRKIENISFTENRWAKYDFMENDWGFFMDNNFDSLPVRNNFLQLYDRLSEYELYAYYLDKAEIDYKYLDNSLNYDKIYDLLKYNVVVAFVGGGSGRQDNEVYSIIKILELTHKTTLGYPKKLCNSNRIYGCDSHSRAGEWMQYLRENKLLKTTHDEPVSFHYE